MALGTDWTFVVVASVAVLAARAFASEGDANQSIFNKVKQTEVIVTNDVTYTPPMFVIGKTDGSISRCPTETASNCEIFHESTDSSLVTATVVHGEFLFASQASGTMLRCSWFEKNSCYVFHKAYTYMTGLAVAAGYIYAGLYNGTILKCDMNKPNSCRTFVNVERAVASLTASGSFIYYGSNGRIDRCSISQKNCSKFCSHDNKVEIRGLAAIENKIYGLRQNGYILSAQNVCNECSIYSVSNYEYSSMTVYNRKLYMARGGEEIHVTDPITHQESIFVQLAGVRSISFAYGTYAMQSRYQEERSTCIWRGVFICPPTVFYYAVESRSSLEVHVKDGLLYDSQGVLVDTSDADETHSQKAAIFVMGPDGQILLSNVHKTGFLHTSSLLAGYPVSGAGLMVVEEGIIRNITACSEHYRPDQELNKQVIESLYLKGYTAHIDSHPCAYSDILCWSGNLGNLQNMN